MKGKKQFFWCELDVSRFDFDDVIATSDVFDDNDDDGGVELPFVPFGSNKNDEFLN